MHNTFEVRSQLAKLLSKENIEVRHGEFRTAFFDVENRVLGLPNWEDRGKDVYDLLVGHEVGHALYTPAAGWHDSNINVEGIPRSFLNIIEDIRIERKIQATYPGLIGSFRRGYGDLFDDDFFGTDGRDLNEYEFIDRINLKAKLGNLVDVDFSDEETPLMRQAFAVETWDDVVNAARDIMAFVKAKKEEEQKEKQVTVTEGVNDENNDGMSLGSDPTNQDARDGDRTDPQSSAAQSSEESHGEDVSESSNMQSGSPDAEEGNDEPQAEASSTDDVKGGDRGFVSETDNHFRSREQELVHEPGEGEPFLVNGISKDQVNKMIIPFRELKLARAERFRTRRDRHISYGTKPEDYDMHKAREQAHIETEYRKFIADNKKVLSMMVKEFEQRKAAFQYSRASTAKTGTIDVTKLHSYKYNDDIFLKVTRLADAKSHGMIMFIDLSGSMHGVIGEVMKQTMLLVQFCKRIGVPFDVYGFTTASGYDSYKRRNGFAADLYGDINIDSIGIINLVSSSMKKAEFNEAFRAMFDYTANDRGDLSSLEDMGGTPLNQTIMAAHHLVAAFKARHHSQKITTVFLTDGEGQKLEFGYDRRYQDQMHSYAAARRLEVKFDNKRFPGQSWHMSTALWTNLKQKEGVQVIGIHLAQHAKDARRFLFNRMDTDDMTQFMQKYARARSGHTKKVSCFNDFFLVSARPKDLKPVDDEFTVDSDASKRVLTSSFSKFAKSKKNNRIVMTAFAQAVA